MLARRNIYVKTLCCCTDVDAFFDDEPTQPRPEVIRNLSIGSSLLPQLAVWRLRALLIRVLPQGTLISCEGRDFCRLCRRHSFIAGAFTNFHDALLLLVTQSRAMVFLVDRVDSDR